MRTAGETVGCWKILAFDHKRKYPGNKGHLCYYQVCCTHCGQQRLKTVTTMRQRCGNCYLLPRGQTGFNKLLGIYRRNSAKQDRPFRLSVEQFKALTSAPCFYCGFPPTKLCIRMNKNGTPGPEWGRYAYNGIDRIDNDAGYVEGNCIPCCELCNRAKNSLGFDLFSRHLRAVYARILAGQLPALLQESTQTSNSLPPATGRSESIVT
jgi:hypothetical protein